ncbi:uncharacterized protein LOC134622880, partial [Pelmatolapia mariae]|uniref:uncharacterized protein LOC134622880 n=1 Tax=Pelmatolapia mariae TaxID=158779 RepID=UPI003211E8E7
MGQGPLALRLNKHPSVGGSHQVSPPWTPPPTLLSRIHIKRDGRREQRLLHRDTTCRITREPPEQQPSSSSSSIRAAVLNISLCPITYYGQKYEQLYVNITSGYVTICFNGFFSPETGGNCLVQSSQGIYYYLFNFGTHAALYFYKYISDPVVGGNTVNSIHSAPSYADYFIDLSGCSYSGQMYRPGTVINSPETCFSLICDETAVLHTSSCGPQEHCQGNNICVLDTMLASTCTVTGPTIIDVNGQMDSIQDRCAYSLFSTPSLPDFHVLGNFRDRRCKDVSFVDSVTLRVDVHYIHLEQGGRVQLDDSTLTLSSSPQLVHGVQLSKDQTGVTAKLSLSNLTISVFFDGYTAQIHLERPAGSSVEGLCGNSSRSLSDLRISEYSSTSCEMQYSETADGTIDCTSVTERILHPADHGQGVSVDGSDLVLTVQLTPQDLPDPLQVLGGCSLPSGFFMVPIRLWDPQ